MVKTVIQLYTLHDFDVSQADKIRIAGETDVDGVEFVFDGSPSQATRDAFTETGLDACGVTVGLDDIDDRFNEIVAACRTLDAETAILGHLDESYFESPEMTKETADLLSAVADRFAEEGLQFLYHTHRHEFVTTEGRTHFDRLVEAVDERVAFEVDLGWAAIAGMDPPSVLRTSADSIRSVHLKDVRTDSEEFVNLGEGDLNVKEDAKAAIEAGVEWLVYEHENPTDPVESVVTGASTLQKSVTEAAQAGHQVGSK